MSFRRFCVTWWHSQLLSLPILSSWNFAQLLMEQTHGT